MTALPTTSQLPGVPPSLLRLGQWGWWNRVDLNMQSRGPLFVQEIAETNPVLAVGFQAFQLECTFTGDHDVTAELVVLDPFTQLPVAPLPPGGGGNFLVGSAISGITEFAVFTFGDGFGNPNIVVGAWHTFLIRFTVNDTLTGTKITADLRGAG